jgi:peptidoglycan/LPS O-acetylase OafA/YrhL
VADNGWIGVDLFLVLSGYLITGILLKTKSTKGYYRNFMARRLLRIFPAYYLFVFVFFIVLPRIVPSNPELAKLPGQQGWYWAYLANVRIFLHGDWDAVYVEHAWSLAIEEQFYLLWPWVVLLCSRRALMAVCLAAVPASLLVRCYLISAGAGRAMAFVLMPSHLDGLALGALLAVVMPAMVEKPDLSLKGLFGVGALGATMLVCLKFLPMSYEMKHLGLGVAVWSLIFASFVGFSVLSPSNSLLSRGLSCRPLVRVGAYSYGLYLWHQPLFRVLAPRIRGLHVPTLLQWSLMGIVGGVLSFAIAAVMFEAFEARFLSLKRHFERPLVP